MFDMPKISTTKKIDACEYVDTEYDSIFASWDDVVSKLGIIEP